MSILVLMLIFLKLYIVALRLKVEVISTKESPTATCREGRLLETLGVLCF